MIIPNSFIRLDTRVNAADSFANVRDLSTAFKNHNKLLAERAKHMLCAMTFDGTPLRSITPITDSRPFCCARFPVTISDETDGVTITISAAQDDGYGETPDDIKLYPVIDLPGETKPPNYDNYMTVDDVDYTTKYTTNIPVAMTGKRRNNLIFSLYMHGGVYGADQDLGKGALMNTTSWGPNWVEADFGSSPLGYVIYSPDVPNLSPQMCVMVEDLLAIAGTPRQRAWVANNWDAYVQTGDDVSIRCARGICLQTLCLYEMNRSGIATANSWAVALP